ncbi:hypothetical protein OGAPHI_003642 [Ogataea philodendri]|uniref:Uncharacterized protein n=1 Tax=Ogataea philodendri TaxID=1378263 RepID=A0A9P8P4M1_9ASCO|nr:uncharacterized protein OGAPHI_003642 [Ogataea philodendri]KAH3665458.1 hypothetical protein OGAPHI_003642 [Ogataea philodendri]
MEEGLSGNTNPVVSHEQAVVAVESTTAALDVLSLDSDSLERSPCAIESRSSSFDMIDDISFLGGNSMGNGSGPQAAVEPLDSIQLDDLKLVWHEDPLAYASEFQQFWTSLKIRLEKSSLSVICEPFEKRERALTLDVGLELRLESILKRIIDEKYQDIRGDGDGAYKFLCNIGDKFGPQGKQRTCSEEYEEVLAKMDLPYIKIPVYPKPISRLLRFIRYWSHLKRAIQDTSFAPLIEQFEQTLRGEEPVMADYNDAELLKILKATISPYYFRHYPKLENLSPSNTSLDVLVKLYKVFTPGGLNSNQITHTARRIKLSACKTELRATFQDIEELHKFAALVGLSFTEQEFCEKIVFSMREPYVTIAMSCIGQPITYKTLLDKLVYYNQVLKTERYTKRR